MALNIKVEATDRLVRELAAETGETITMAALLFKGSDFSQTDIEPAGVRRSALGETFSAPERRPGHR